MKRLLDLTSSAATQTSQPILSSGLSRRDFLRCSALLLSLSYTSAQAANLLAVRVWPAPDYSRVTLESDTPLEFTYKLFHNTERLVVDIRGLVLNDALRSLVAKVLPDDPFISSVRVGQTELKVVRLVFDLRTPVLPRMYTLTPVAIYQHRLIFDLYPEQELDPIANLISSKEAGFAAFSKTTGASAAALPASMPAAIAASSTSRLASLGASSASRSQAPGSGGMDPLGDLIGLSDRGLLANSTSPTTPSQASSKTKPTAIANNSTASKRTSPVYLKTREYTITLDPGHGGEDPGAVGPTGTYEKHIVLSIAFHLRNYLLGISGMRVLMTRDRDFFVPLGQRVFKARKVKSNLFISIHADAFTTPTAKGASVFALSEHGASSTAARFLARSQNASDEIGGVSFSATDQALNSVLLDLSTSGQIKQSLTLGEMVLAELSRVGNLHRRKPEQASFAVLKAPDVPSILVESAFISNPEEEQRLKSNDYQNAVALAMFNGVKRYLQV